jgi:membrane-associated phospholipid phosphatase
MLFKRFFDEITNLGGFIVSSFFAFSFLVFGTLYQFLQVCLALFSIYFLTFVIRLFYFKDRPKKMHHKNFLEKIDASAFPSIHAARAIFMLIFLTYYLPFNILFFTASSVAAFLVVFSRIYLGKHDIYDVIGGIILGLLSSLWVIII